MLTVVPPALDGLHPTKRGSAWLRVLKFRGSFDVVHFRYGPSVPFLQHSTPPRGDAVEFMFRREQSNSTGGTFTHVKARVSWEDSGDGNKRSQGTEQAGSASKTGPVAGEVGVPHSTVDLHYFKACREGRGDTDSTRGGEAKEAGMAGATQIKTPQKVRQLQITLYRKAKAQAKYRFWSGIEPKWAV